MTCLQCGQETDENTACFCLEEGVMEAKHEMELIQIWTDYLKLSRKEQRESKRSYPNLFVGDDFKAFVKAKGGKTK